MQGETCPWRPLRYPFSHGVMFEALLCVIVLVHLHLQYRIWIRGETDVFSKYRKPDSPPLAIASRAYLAKAVWLISLILVQYVGVEFRSAVVFTFAGYAVLLQILLPGTLYNRLNLGLALIFLLGWWMHWPGAR